MKILKTIYRVLEDEYQARRVVASVAPGWLSSSWRRAASHASDRVQANACQNGQSAQLTRMPLAGEASRLNRVMMLSSSGVGWSCG